jgi:hypothetical protein
VAKTTRTSKRKSNPRRRTEGPRCGLCGKTANLTRTDCCGNWICDDEDEYVLFSFARNSCHRNHSRYTLCAVHFNEGHTGDWKTCKKCRTGYETEMYVWYATNEHNFEKLESPPAYEPTKCSTCGKVIRLSEGGYSMTTDGYFCTKCSNRQFGSAD